MNAPILAVDGGQTGTRAILASPSGRVLGRGSGPAIRHLFGEGGAEAREAIRTAIGAAYAGAGLQPGEAAAVVCGITSVLRDTPEAAKVDAAVRSIVTPGRIEIVPDYVTNLLGASGGEPGVVVVAGGGSVAYGLTADGREATAGGFGYLLGDEGGGYDIGRRALAAAIRSDDGRGEPTALGADVLAAFGTSEVAAIKAIVYAPDFSRDRIAALAPIVSLRAAGGDAVARRILAEAGEKLAEAALAVIRRLFAAGETVAVYPTGGVFGAGESLTRPFQARLRAGWPDVEVRPPQRPPVVGALIRALRLAGCISPVPSVHIC